MKRTSEPCHWTPAGPMLRRHVRACVSTVCEGCKPCPEPQHCEVKARCVNHPSPGDTACVKCVKAGRREIRLIMDLAALTPAAALEAGALGSELATLAGPASNPFTLSARRVHLRRIVDGITGTREAVRSVAFSGIPEREVPGEAAGYLAEIDEDDPFHPAAVLSRWAMMTGETMGLRVTLRGAATVAGSGAFLLRHLHVIANAPEHGYPDMLAELRDCRQHLEARMATDRRPEEGAPCPRCGERYRDALEAWRATVAAWEAMDPTERAPEPPRKPDGRPRPLVKWHNVEDLTGASDEWRCGTCALGMPDSEYRSMVTAAARAHAVKLTSAQITETYAVKPGTLRRWVHDGKVRRHGTDSRGRHLYDVADVLACKERRPAAV